MNRPVVSEETATYCELRGFNEKNRFKTISPIPYDKYDCVCKPDIDKYFQDISKGKKPDRVTCRHDRKGYNFYEIKCKKCGSVVATCWAKDTTMTDFFDLHYTCETDGKHWYGALSLNLSPIDGKLGIECACGQDTRDFRANNTLPHKVRLRVIAENSRGNRFGESDSKFVLVKVK